MPGCLALSAGRGIQKARTVRGRTCDGPGRPGYRGPPRVQPRSDLGSDRRRVAHERIVYEPAIARVGKVGLPGLRDDPLHDALNPSLGTFLAAGPDTS